jgi:4'-phosphopantetheinyl transferase
VPDWLASPERPTFSGPPLGGPEVHLWRTALSVPTARMAVLYATLSAEEQDRAGRFRLEHSRQAFVAAHGALRAILGRYLEASPQTIQFRCNSHGKPELAAPEQAWLRFSLAHSGNLALCAVTAGREVGVDVEKIRPVDDLDKLVARFFAPGERAAFESLPPAQRLPAFFAGWTRKEAYIKAWGLGLSLPLDEFEVSLSPGEAAALLADRHNPAGEAPWSLCEIDVGPDYAAALAAPGALARLEFLTAPAG